MSVRADLAAARREYDITHTNTKQWHNEFSQSYLFAEKCGNYSIVWKFPEIGVPPNHPF